MSGMSETVSYDNNQINLINRERMRDYFLQRFGAFVTPKKLDFNIADNDNYENWMDTEEDNVDNTENDYAVGESLGF